VKICRNTKEIFIFKSTNFYKEMYARGQVLPPGIHFFVKIMSFELLYFLRITADLYETSQFYYFKYDQSDRKLHFLIKQIFKKIHCTGNSFIRWNVQDVERC
jgi:hypothetical protein